MIFDGLPRSNVSDVPCDFVGFTEKDTFLISETDVYGNVRTSTKQQEFQQLVKKYESHQILKAINPSDDVGITLFALDNVHSLISGMETTGIPKVITEVDDECKSDFVILKHGSQRNGEILIFSNGFQSSFRTDCIYKHKRIYRCRATGCNASLDLDITGTKIEFHCGHTHNRRFDNAKKPVFLQKVKDRAASNPFENAHALVSNMYKCAGTDRQFIQALGLGTRYVLWKNMKRMIYRIRRQTPLPNIRNMFDDHDCSNLPNFNPKFVRFDLKFPSGKEYGRFIGLAYDTMLRMMQNASIWFLDGTFHVVRPPFMQLLIIHITLCTESDLSFQSLPVFYILMTGQKIAQYVACFEAVLQILFDIFKVPVQVTKIMVDFEKVLWTSIRSLMSDGILPSVTFKGYSFHLAQAVFRRVQELRLVKTYFESPSSKRIITSLMHLSFLPEEEILPAFNRLRAQYVAVYRLNNKAKLLVDLCDYYYNTWFNVDCFQISDWC